MNSVHLIGRLGKDADLRYSASGKAFAKFSLATNGYKKDSPPDWHNIVVWDKTAENLAKYLLKGSQIFVGGRLTYNKWTDKNGVERITAEVMAHTIELLGSKPKDKTAEPQAPDPELTPDAEGDDLPF